MSEQESLSSVPGHEMIAKIWLMLFLFLSLFANLSSIVGGSEAETAQRVCGDCWSEPLTCHQHILTSLYHLALLCLVKGGEQKSVL